MAINAMENETFTPTTGESGWSKFLKLIGYTLAAFVVIFLLAYFGKPLYDHYTMPAPISAVIEKATSGDTVAVGYQNYCANGQCVSVKMCTAVSDECGDMTPGKPADYGTGTHKSADGRTRPNPPAGWQWSGK